MIIIASILVISASVLLASILQIKTKPATLVAWYLLSFANIVLTGEIANIFSQLNRQAFFLLIHFVIMLLSLTLWLRKGRPHLFGAFKNWREELKREKFLAMVKNWPDLTLYAIGIAVLFALLAMLIVVVPQNNNDSLSTHLSRIGYWLQFGSFLPWPTSRNFQLVYPINAQLQTFWSALFTHSDQWVGFTQWTSALITSVGIFGIARLLSVRRAPAAFAGLTYLSYPLVVLQATTTQTDLVAAGLYVSAVYFLLLGVQTNHRGILFLSALGISLGLGTKQIFYFLLPGLAITLPLIWRKFGKKAFQNTLFWIASGFIAFIFFASYINISNYNYFGTPFGPPRMMNNSVGGKSPTDAAYHIFYNIPRLLYQSLDSSGLPQPFNRYVHKSKEKAAGYFLDKLGFTINGTEYAAPGHEFSLAEANQAQEDHAWYGLVSVLFLFPAMLSAILKKSDEKSWIRISLTLNFILFLLVTAWLRPGWDPYQGRYFASVIAVNTPLIAVWINPAKKKRWLRWVLVLLSLTIATTTVLYNPAKPLRNQNSTKQLDVWTANRIEIQTLQSGGYRQMYLQIDEEVPADATIGLLVASHFMDYPLFGEDFSRTVIPIYPLENIGKSAWLDAQGLDYILIQNPTEETLSALPDGATLARKGASWALFSWKNP